MNYNKTLLHKQYQIICKQLKNNSSGTVIQFLNNLLKNTGHEKQIDATWEDEFHDIFEVDDNLRKASIKGIKWDEYLIPRKNSKSHMHLLAEYKAQDEYGTGGLDSRKNRIKVLAQLIHYMYKIRYNSSYADPNVLVGADEYHSFVVSAKPFLKYVNRSKYNWQVTPRDAFAGKDTALIRDLYKDRFTNYIPFNFNSQKESIQENFMNLVHMLITIQNIGKGQNSYLYPMTINLTNIYEVYKCFNKIVQMDPRNVNVGSIDRVSVFVQLITSNFQNHFFLEPNNKDKAVFTNHNINLYFDVSSIHALMSRYNFKFNSSNKKIQYISDTLIDDLDRRISGEFWTSNTGALEADKYMNKYIDANYKKKCLIWDPACGGCNLIKPTNLIYNDLYLSTLYQSELDSAGVYTKKAKEAFQYNFLNDDVKNNPKDNSNSYEWYLSSKAPRLFKELMHIYNSNSNKKIIFFTNPPYGTASNGNIYKKTSKTNTTTTNSTHDLMREKKCGNSSQQLYAQFFYRTIKTIKDFNLKNSYIAFFTKPQFMSGGSSWFNFDKILFSNFKFVAGFEISAGEFNGTTDKWPVTFSIFKYRNKKLGMNKLNKLAPFKLTLMKCNKKGLPTVIGYHNIYMVNSNDSLSNWVRKPVKDIRNKNKLIYLKRGTYPSIANAVDLSKGNESRGRMAKNSLGFIRFDGDNIESKRFIYITSSATIHGFNIMPNVNALNRAVVGFAARNVISSNWVNAKDNYVKPDTSKMSNKEWLTFVNDCLIYSLFSSSSNQASITFNNRNHTYTNIQSPGRWANKMFWINHKDVVKYLKQTRRYTLLRDATTYYNNSNDFMVNQIYNRKFSVAAQEVFDDVNRIWKRSLNNRTVDNVNNKKYSLNNWDIGWYQIKHINGVINSNDYHKEYNDFKRLTKQIKKGVYKLDML